MNTLTETGTMAFSPDLAREPEELSIEQLEEAQGGIFMFVAGFAAGVALGVAIGKAL